MSLLPGAPYDPLGGIFGGGPSWMPPGGGFGGGMPPMGGGQRPGVGGIYERIMGGLLGPGPQGAGGLLDPQAQADGLPLRRVLLALLELYAAGGMTVVTIADAAPEPATTELSTPSSASHPVEPSPVPTRSA